MRHSGAERICCAQGLGRGPEKKGLEQGRERGLEQGLKQGLKQGREQGLEQGREEAKLSIARKLFKAGTPIDVIVSSTGVDKGTIASFTQSE